MKKTNTRVEEFIRVDHAGERGAVKIYEGQLLALNTLVKNESLKKEITTYLIEGNDKESINKKINTNYEKIIREINENSNIQIIIKNKNEEEVSNLLDELFKDHKEQSNLRKIESLEQKLINNLDENSYSELIKLKNQINSE